MSVKMFVMLAFLFSLMKEHETSTESSMLLIVVSSFPDYNTTHVKLTVHSTISSINNSSSILSGNDLGYTVLDSMCNREHTERMLRQQLSTGKLPTAIIGCGCSSATEATADIINQYPVPVISYSSPSAKLKNSTLYPSLFQTVPTFSTIDDALTKFVLHFNWKQILLVTEEMNFFVRDLRASLTQNGIALTSTNAGYSDNEIFNSGNRVFVLDEYGQTARNILCRAYQHKIYYPGYAWMIIDNFIEDDWFEFEDSNCTFEEIQRVLNYSVLIETIPSIGKDDISQYAHDAVMAIALAIDKNKNNNDNRSLIDYLRTTSFNGSSEKATWKTSNTSISFTQIIFNGSFSRKAIGIYGGRNLVINYSQQTIWPLGTPSDGIPVIVIESIQVWAFVIAILMSLGGIIWTSVCLAFVFIYRKAKVVKLTSPKLNYLLLFGSFCVFLSVILYSFPSTKKEVFDILCPIQPFVGSILGYDICVTVTTVKLWRIYYIFKGPHPSQRIPKDWQMLAIISILISVDTFFSIILIIIDIIWFPPMLIHENKADSFDPMTGETLSFYFWDCRYSTYTFSLVAVLHNFAVHGIGLLFAFKTRKIKVTILNEYKYNLAILAVSIAVTIMTFIFVYAIGPDPSLFAFFYSVFVTTGCALFIGLTFVPKMIALKNDPLGEKIFMDNMGMDLKDIQNQAQENVTKISGKPPSDDQE